MNRAERRRAARDMTHATQSIMRARGATNASMSAERRMQNAMQSR